MVLLRVVREHLEGAESGANSRESGANSRERSFTLLVLPYMCKCPHPRHVCPPPHHMGAESGANSRERYIYTRVRGTYI